MQLRQLRYVIAVAESGSINAASQKLYVSQSSVSVAIQEIEQEMGVTIFNRSNRGIELTADGVELVSYAREVVAQADRMLTHYKQLKEAPRARLAISTQHYPIAMQAFLDIVDMFSEGFELTYRETSTSEVIDDVKSFRSELGILYLSDSNRSFISRLLETAHLTFTSLFQASPRVVVGPYHPLAAKELVTLEDLAPYPRFVYDQGKETSSYFAEEPLTDLPCTSKISISEYYTLLQLLTRGMGYTIGSGVLPHIAGNQAVSVPFDTDVTMNVGYIVHEDIRMNDQARLFLQLFARRITDYGAYEGLLVPSNSIDETLSWEISEE